MGGKPSKGTKADRRLVANRKSGSGQQSQRSAQTNRVSGRKISK